MNKCTGMLCCWQRSASNIESLKKEMKRDIPDFVRRYETVPSIILINTEIHPKMAGAVIRVNDKGVISADGDNAIIIKHDKQTLPQHYLICHEGAFSTTVTCHQCYHEYDGSVELVCPSCGADQTPF